MDFLTKDELKSLMDEQSFPCISIYFPTVRAGDQIQQNPIRFKNLLRQAEDRLQEHGMSTEKIQKYTGEAWDLLNNEPFWRRQSDGLAVFLSENGLRSYRLPLDLSETVIIGENFHLKPLLPLFSGNGRFYVLALSQDEVRVLAGNRDSIDQIEVDDMPPSLAEALKWDDPEKQRQYHDTGSGPGGSIGGETNVVRHGQGVGQDDQKTRIQRYFHKVAAALENFLAEEKAPLVVAGVDYLHPIYQEVNRYPHLIEKGIEGNPEHLKAKELHELAWELVEPYFMEEQEKAAALYQQQAGMEAGRAASELSEIVLAAYQGRVGQLFVPLGIEQWGTVDWSSGEVEFHEEQSLENVDLIDLAAMQTFINGGVVYAVQPAELPEDAPSAAVLRY